MREDQALLSGYVVAGLGPLAVTAALSPLRDEPHRISLVLLGLVVVIATAAVLAGPAAGVTATLTAALSFDFDLVAPYGALKFNGNNDLWFVLLLLAVGSAIVAATRRRWPPAGDGAARPKGLEPNSSQHIERIVLLIEQRTDVRDLISAMQAELTALLLARSCRFEGGSHAGTRPCLKRNGTVVGPSGDAGWPDTELELPVRARAEVIGRFVIEPTPGAAVPLDHRIVAVILTDHLATALTGRNPVVPPKT